MKKRRRWKRRVVVCGGKGWNRRKKEMKKRRRWKRRGVVCGGKDWKGSKGR